MRKPYYQRGSPPEWVESVRVREGYEYNGTVSIDGKRHYDISGNLYKSVTTFLGERADNSWIDDITSVIGEDKFKKLSHIGASNGTLVHDMCEKYLRGDLVKPMPNVSLQWKALYDNLFSKNRIGKLYLLEGVVASHKLKLAGRCDLIADLDEVPHVIDFKNVSVMKTAEEIESYWLQACLYSLMFYESYGISIRNLAIIMTSSTGQLSVMKSNFDNHKERLMQLIRGEISV